MRKLTKSILWKFLSPAGKRGSVHRARRHALRGFDRLETRDLMAGFESRFESEPNDTTALANQLTLSEPIRVQSSYYVSGVVNGQGGFGRDTSDYYRVTFEQDVDASFRVYGLRNDLNLVVLGNDRKQLSSSINRGMADEVVNLSKLPAGTYYVQVVKPSSGGSTPYSLGVQGLVLNDADNSSATATSIGTLNYGSTSLTGRMNAFADPQDWYRFSVAHNSHVTVSLSGTAGADVDLEVLSANGETLGRSAIVGGANELVFLNKAAASSSYLIKVSASTTAAYQITVAAQASDASGTLNLDRESNETLSTAQSVGSLKTGAPLQMQGTMGTSDKNDWYKFNLSRPSTVSALLNGFKTDIDLGLYDSQGSLLHSSARPKLTSEGFSIQGLPAGDYYLATSRWGTRSTGYRLSLSANNGTAPASPLVSGPVGTQSTATPTVSWTPVLGATSYQVQVRSILNNSLVYTSSVITGNSLVLPSLRAGGYRVEVAATNSEGLSPWVSPGDFEIPYSALTTVLVGGEATFGASSKVRVNASWPAVPDATAYEVELTHAKSIFDASTPAPRATIFRNTSTTFSYLMGTEGVLTATVDYQEGLYQIRVRPLSGTLQGSWSNPAPFYYLDGNAPEQIEVDNYYVIGFKSEPVAPLVSGPTGVQTTTTPQVVWSRIINADMYEVRVRPQLSETVLYESGPVTTTTLTLPALTPGKYRVDVRATNGYGDSPWSTARDFELLPGVPQLVGGETTFSTSTKARVNAVWEEVSDAEKYEVEFSRLKSIFDSVTPTPGTTVLTTATTTFSHLMGAEGGISSTVDYVEGLYQIRIRSVAGGARSGWSNSATFYYMDGNAPTQGKIDSYYVIGLNTTPFTPTLQGPSGTLSGNSADFTWTEILNATSYVIRVRASTTDEVLYQSEPFSYTNVTITGLPPGRMLIDVQASNQHGDSDWSNTLTVDVPLGTPELAGESATFGLSTKTTLEIDWEAILGATKHQVELSKSGSSPWYRTTGSSNWYSWQIAAEGGVTPSTVLSEGLYRVRVRAGVGDSWGNWSNYAEFYFMAGKTPTQALLNAYYVIGWE